MKVLICPLNWGLGHATRSSQLIESMIQSGHEVHLGSDGLAAVTLQKAYPQLPMHTLASLDIQYGKWFWVKLFKQAYHLIAWDLKDQVRIKELQDQYHFDLILSDSRTGARSKKTKSIMLTHQCTPIVPFNFIIDKMYWSRLKEFDEIWIPDLPNQKLSGQLSNLPNAIKRKYTGYLSRIPNHTFDTNKNQIKNKVLAIVSGPEPSRSDFEKKLMQELKFSNAIIVGGRPDRTNQENGLIQYYSYLDAESLAVEIEKAEYIICRAGYSTLMDLTAFRKKLIMVPTPGQPEQNYLARHIQGMNMGIIWNMNQYTWPQIKIQVDKKSAFGIENQPELLEEAILSLN